MKLEGYINCDLSPQVNPDKIVNLEESLPFEDNSVDEIIAYHILEHITNFTQLIKEFHRICKDNAVIKIKVPFYLSYCQATDPTHVRSFTPYTFNYFGNNSNQFSHEVTDKILFKSIKPKINYLFSSERIVNKIVNTLTYPIFNLNHKIYCKLFAGILTATEIEFKLEVFK